MKNVKEKIFALCNKLKKIRKKIWKIEQIDGFCALCWNDDMAVQIENTKNKNNKIN